MIPLNYILLLDSNLTDAEKIHGHLSRSELKCRFASLHSVNAFERSLSQKIPDVVLCDYQLEDGTGLEALGCLRNRSKATPFIFVTEILGEERVAAAFQLGATDYVLKQHLSLLVPAIRRALRETQAHAHRVQAESKYRDLSAHLQQLLEGERTRIARLVHDELGQSLAALKMDLALISKRLPKDLRPTKKKIEYLLRDTDQVILAVRKLITDLRPGILDDLGILAALEWQASDFQKRTGIQCMVSTTLKDSARRPELDTVIFRIFQGLLANIHQHADATKITIHSTEHGGIWHLVVEDNGRGMSVEDTQKRLSFGILGMRERASKFGGSLAFESIQPHGTRVTLSLPLPSEAMAVGGDA